MWIFPVAKLRRGSASILRDSDARIFNITRYCSWKFRSFLPLLHSRQEPEFTMLEDNPSSVGTVCQQLEQALSCNWIILPFQVASYAAMLPSTLVSYGEETTSKNRSILWR